MLVQSCDSLLTGVLVPALIKMEDDDHLPEQYLGKLRSDHSYLGQGSVRASSFS